VAKNREQTAKPQTIDEYIATFPEQTQQLLETMRQTIRGAAPDAEEAMSYAIPTFKQNGVLVHFAAFKEHVGFYPTPSGMEAFQEELSVYKGGKGSVKFPMDQDLPLDLVTRITKFRVQENLNKK
jgi:uncharacterized protein YdhG (YjbR/CyaY superfamily)